MVDGLLRLYSGGVCITWGYLIFLLLDTPAGELKHNVLVVICVAFIAGWLWPLLVLLLLILLLVLPYTE